MLEKSPPPDWSPPLGWGFHRYGLVRFFPRGPRGDIVRTPLSQAGVGKKQVITGWRIEPVLTGHEPPTGHGEATSQSSGGQQGRGHEPSAQPAAGENHQLFPTSPCAKLLRPREYGTPVAYEKGARIGRGTFGQVVRGKAVPFGGEFALKVFMGPGAQAAAVFEAMWLERCAHPSIIRLLDSFQGDPQGVDEAGLVFPLMDSDLEHDLRRRPEGYEPAVIRSILKPVCGALSHLHGLHLLHADIKPSNILVGYGVPGGAALFREVVVADLGSVVEVAQHAKKGPGFFAGGVTGSGGGEPRMGWGHGGVLQKATSQHRRKLRENQLADGIDLQTVFYRAPEILFGNQDYDGKIDCWSAGMVLAEVTGCRFHRTVANAADTKPLAHANRLCRFFRRPPVTNLRAPPAAPDAAQDGPQWPRATWEALGQNGMLVLDGCLHWSAADRWSARAALESPFFTPEGFAVGGTTGDGKQDGVAAAWWGGGGLERCVFGCRHGLFWGGAPVQKMVLQGGLRVNFPPAGRARTPLVRGQRLLGGLPPPLEHLGGLHGARGAAVATSRCRFDAGE